MLSSKLCWQFRKNVITSIILNPTFFVSLKKQNCVNKTLTWTHKTFSTFSVCNLNAIEIQTIVVLSMNPNKKIYNLHISSRDWDVYCCLVPKRYDGTPWLLFFQRSSRHHCFCWKGQISMDIILRAIEIEQDMFCSVLEGFIPSTSSKASSKLWVYHLLCPLKLIHCLSHKCFFHLSWHLTGPSFNSVTFHHPAGSTWSSYLSRPAWVQLESHLNANRLPSTEAVNQPDIRRTSAIQAT